MAEGTIMDNNSKLIIYTAEDGQTKVHVTVDSDTVWLSKSQMAELFNAIDLLFRGI